MRRLSRLALFAATASGLCLSSVSAACSVMPPPEPPPRTASESDSQFAARKEKWYRDIFEAEKAASLPGRVAHEERLWTTAGRVVLARLEKIGSIRLRGSEGQAYKSPLATLRAIRWLKGNPSPRALKVHDLSDDSCDSGAGDAPEGEVGEVFLLFYRAGPVEPRAILDTFSGDRAVSSRSRAAFGR